MRLTTYALSFMLTIVGSIIDAVFRVTLDWHTNALSILALMIALDAWDGGRAPWTDQRSAKQ